MSNNIKYGSRILDMGVLLEMKALVNAMVVCHGALWSVGSLPVRSVIRNNYWISCHVLTTGCAGFPQ